MDYLHPIPVNRIAALVISGGVNYNSKKKIQTNDSEFPIAIRSNLIMELRNPAFQDLTGMKFGRFIVLGMARDFRNQWVVRCSCGIYTTRSAKAIKNISNNADCCEICRELNYLKRSDYYRRTGKDLEELGR